MADKRTPILKSFQWRLECLGHTLVDGLAGLLPGPWAFHLGEALATLAWHLMPKRQKVVLRNLRIIHGDTMSLEDTQQLAKASFRRSGANLISTAHTAQLNLEDLREALVIENLDLIENALNQNKGVILLTSHMGNWELLTRLLHFFPEGAKLGAFYRPLNNPLLDERVLNRRQADGCRMFSKRDPFHKVTSFLRDGGIVGILADQRVGRQGKVVNFFGRTTHTSPLPSLLARRSKSEVLALSLITESPGKWKATFHSVKKPYTTEHCMESLEQAMRESIVDVFWLQERWRAFISKNRALSLWLDQPAACNNDTRYRALLWLADTSSPAPIPDAWLHPNIIYEIALTANQSVPNWLSEYQIHRVTCSNNLKSLRRELSEIDKHDIYPVDYILSQKAPSLLTKAAKLEAIPLVSL